MGLCSSSAKVVSIDGLDFSEKELDQCGLPLPSNFCKMYEIVPDCDGRAAILGHGSFSTVFKCRSLQNKDEVYALKHVDMTRIARRGGSEAVERTKGEVRRGVSVLMNLSHPSIISLSNYFEGPNTMCVVLELARTELFDHVVESGKLTEIEAADILRTVTAGVNFMHEKNLVHRDLKPENIVLGVQGTWKIIDFGFSRVVKSNLSRMNSFVGTMNYVAPEVVERQEYTNSVDIWSIGVVAFVLLAGYLPFKVDSPENRAQHNYEVSFKSKHWDKISFAAKTFVARCLSKDPTERPTAAELLEMSFLNLGMHRQRRESLLPLGSPTRLKDMVAGVEKIEKEDVVDNGEAQEG